MPAMKILAVLTVMLVATMITRVQNVRTKQAAFQPNNRPMHGCHRVSNSELFQAIKNSGVLSNPSIKLIQVKGQLRSALRRNNGTLTIEQARYRRDIEVCEEQETLEVVEANEYMAYAIKSIKCVGDPYCLTARMSSSGEIGAMMNGRCQLRQSAIAVTVAANCYGMTTKTVKVGCSCKCMC